MSPFDIAVAASGQALYRVVTAKGAPIAAIPATSDQRQAMASAKNAVEQYPGCYVQEAEIVVRLRRVYRPRSAASPARDAFAIPALPEGAVA